jgi:hypothetical protein
MSRNELDNKLEIALRCLYCVEAGLLLLALIVAL